MSPSAAAAVAGCARSEATISQPVKRPIDGVSRRSHAMSRLGPFFAILAFAALRSYAATMEVHVRDPAGKPVADAAVYAVALAPPDTRGNRPLTAAIEQVD